MTRDLSLVGYCTNVHAGADLDSTRASLERYALAVKARVSPDGPMGIGLWLSANTARKLIADGEVETFGRWLKEVGLVPYTFNGFPHGDFHQEVVKHRVYEPTWWEEARLQYTLDLIQIQHALLPAGMEGGISTLPISWGQPFPDFVQIGQAAVQLAKVADHLQQLESSTGRLIYLCLEPEPGCVFQRTPELVCFFQQYLFARSDPEKICRYLRVCHDVCHASVMFEPQAEVWDAYRKAGIRVGKVQVSAAVRAAWEEMGLNDRPAAFRQLSDFNEKRYLHQTVTRQHGHPERFFEDLPPALEQVKNPGGLRGEWRVHFHVPIYLERFGHLQSSQNDIVECLQVARDFPEVKHFEVETYAWNVLPTELQQPDLAAGIAQEMEWFLKQTT
ncbi:MAG TPA: metabolite traffic protein EboE [Gemmataceae bacterium]|jgi:hypothetical protein|nr:metabolite traffic protein EboE [Gemmataceae bacterium]